MRRALLVPGILAAVAFCVMGCGEQEPLVPAGLLIQYESDVTGAKIVVQNPLADVIITELNTEPDGSVAREDCKAFESEKRLYIGTKAFHVLRDSVTLFDTQSARSWEIKGIEAKLDALMNKAIGKPDSGGALSPENIQKVSVSYRNPFPPKPGQTTQPFDLTAKEIEEFRSLFPDLGKAEGPGCDSVIPPFWFDVQFKSGKTVGVQFCGDGLRTHDPAGNLDAPDGLREFLIKAIESRAGKLDWGGAR